MLPLNATEALNAFVFYFALPAMLFRIVATAKPEQLLDFRFAVSYVIGSAFMFALGVYVSRHLWASSRKIAYARGTAVAHGNIGYLGLALVAEIYGPQFLASVAIAILCDVLTVITTAIILYERNQVIESGQSVAMRTIALQVVSGLVRSPIVMSLILGLIWLIFGFQLPQVIDNFTRLLAAAAGTCALFAIGASMGVGVFRVDKITLSLIAKKLVIHPAVAALLMFWALEVDPQKAAIGVLCASLPGASNTYILARRYGVDAETLSTSIVLGTFISVLTVSFVIWSMRLIPPVA